MKYILHKMQVRACIERGWAQCIRLIIEIDQDCWLLGAHI